MNYLAVPKKLIQHCKSTILQFKKEKKKKGFPSVCIQEDLKDRLAKTRKGESSRYRDLQTCEDTHPKGPQMAPVGYALA